MFVVWLGENNIGGNIYFSDFSKNLIDRTISQTTAKKFFTLEDAKLVVNKLTTEHGYKDLKIIKLELCKQCGNILYADV